MSLIKTLVWCVAAFASGPVAAQEFGLYLLCSGQVQAKDRSLDAHVDLALRRNSSLALIQRSNVLQVGERMKLQISPTHYSMVSYAPSRGSVLYHDWSRGAVYVWAPDLLNLHTTRLSVDRQTAALEGEMLDGTGGRLGLLKMRCEPKNNDTVEAPKF